MDEPKWTPGPWRAVRSDPAEGADVWWLCAGEGNQEFELGSLPGGWPAEREEANARPIAAAPDLYEALANLVPRFERACRHAGSDDEFIAEATKPMRDALEKARGKP